MIGIMSSPVKEPYVIRGLPNLGATCYLNSILQILCNITPMRQLIRVSSASHNPDQAANDVCTTLETWLTGHIKQETSDQENMLNLRAFIIKFIQYYNNFGGGMQDQHEYLTLLLKVIHDSRCRPCHFNVIGQKKGDIDDLEEKALTSLRKDGMWTSFDNLSGGPDTKGWNSVVFQTFTGQYHFRTICSNEECGFVSHRFETFRVMELDIPAGSRMSIKDCLENTFNTSQLDSENLYECDKCKLMGKSTRRMSLWRLPPVLIVCLKRFIAKYDNGQVHLGKNNASVEFPVNLDIDRWVELQCNTKYSLYAVAHHIGNQQGGHCFTTIKSPDNKWFLVDDHNVSGTETLHENFEGSSPYLLFYTKSEDASS
jgi:ubiquitin carboxyl-terminal hydrolase 8